MRFVVIVHLLKNTNAGACLATGRAFNAATSIFNLLHSLQSLHITMSLLSQMNCLIWGQLASSDALCALLSTYYLWRQQLPSFHVLLICLLSNPGNIWIESPYDIGARRREFREEKWKQFGDIWNHQADSRPLNQLANKQTEFRLRRSACTDMKLDYVGWFDRFDRTNSEAKILKQVRTLDSILYFISPITVDLFLLVWLILGQ